ncbi:hypothetical protein [Micavibrio aeruginosavorus]|uniref:hypothetical protein n=1 Tax=Micavibrio aeruginosavorus TaxID=349221 RepID=UPI003F4A8F5C
MSGDFNKGYRDHQTGLGAPSTTAQRGGADQARRDQEALERTIRNSMPKAKKKPDPVFIPEKEGKTDSGNGFFKFLAFCAFIGVLVYDAKTGGSSSSKDVAAPETPHISGQFHCVAKGSYVTLSRIPFDGYSSDGSLIQEKLSQTFKRPHTNATIDLRPIADKARNCDQAFKLLRQEYPKL